MASRQRIQRLARSFSHGWGMPPKRSSAFVPLDAEAAQLPGVAGILGVPAAALGQVVDLRGGTQASSAVALLRRLPSASRHSCSVRSSSEDAPLAARNRTMMMTTRGGALPVALVAAALERVLHLQPQLPGQAAR